MTADEIRVAWEEFMIFARTVAGDAFDTHSRMSLTEQFVDLMKAFGHNLTDEDVYVATGFWESKALL